MCYPHFPSYWGGVLSLGQAPLAFSGVTLSLSLQLEEQR